jgi:hypothetical protein
MCCKWIPSVMLPWIPWYVLLGDWWFVRHMQKSYGAICKDDLHVCAVLASTAGLASTSVHSAHGCVGLRALWMLLMWATWALETDKVCRACMQITAG